MLCSRDAGWSSLVARRAHNPKVAGSNPAPATTKLQVRAGARAPALLLGRRSSTGSSTGWIGRDRQHVQLIGSRWQQIDIQATDGGWSEAIGARASTAPGETSTACTLCSDGRAP